MIGIDLGVQNLGVYSPYLGFRTYTQTDSFLTLVDCIAELTKNEVCFVDFSWNINNWPGNRRTKLHIIFLAATIYNSADLCYFVEPAQIREWLGFGAVVQKTEVHKTAKILYPEILNQNSHEVDAYLLYKWGEKHHNEFG